MITGKPLLLGLLRKKTSKDGSITIEFVWLRILLFFLVLIITIWLSIASLLFCYFKYSKEFYSVKFSNMLILPLKYKDHLKEMGDYHVSLKRLRIKTSLMGCVC